MVSRPLDRLVWLILLRFHWQTQSPFLAWPCLPLAWSATSIPRHPSSDSEGKRPRNGLRRKQTQSLLEPQMPLHPPMEATSSTRSMSSLQPEVSSARSCTHITSSSGWSGLALRWLVRLSTPFLVLRLPLALVPQLVLGSLRPSSLRRGLFLLHGYLIDWVFPSLSQRYFLLSMRLRICCLMRAGDDSGMWRSLAKRALLAGELSCLGAPGCEKAGMSFYPVARG